MKTVVSIILVSIFTFSCNTEIKQKCSYTLDMVKNGVDSSLYKISYSPEGHVYDLIEKGGGDSTYNENERGLYKFDSLKRLRAYAYLYDNKNNASFSIVYDENGKEIKHHGGEVVRWIYRDIIHDSTRVTFFLYAINRLYKDLKIITPKNEIINIDKLHTSPIFFNLLAGRFTFSKSEYNTIKFILTGKRTNTCTQETLDFRDSLIIRKERL